MDGSAVAELLKAPEYTRAEILMQWLDTPAGGPLVLGTLMFAWVVGSALFHLAGAVRESFRRQSVSK